MAVFTELAAEDFVALLADFDLGDFVAYQPIAAGIENTNYYLDTTRGQWVLTVFERLAADQIPFYLELCEHLAKKGCRVAQPQKNKKGELFSFVKGKPFSIANRIAGVEAQSMGLAECRSMGQLLAQMHLATRDFPLFQKNLRGLAWWLETLPKVLPHIPATLQTLLSSEVAYQKALSETPDFKALEVGACHCDLFRNNALIANPGTEGATVAGVFDFYFAGCSPLLFDLAVTVNDWCVDLTSGAFVAEKLEAFLRAYIAVRPLTDTERRLWRDMLRAAALRFWMSRLFDFYLPRKASLLKPHDPTHFERILKDRLTCALHWPDSL